MASCLSCKKINNNDNKQPTLAGLRQPSGHAFSWLSFLFVGIPFYTFIPEKQEGPNDPWTIYLFI